MTESATKVTWLTQDAFDRLKAELEHLSGEGRTELAKKIEEARSEGDLKENGGYHAAKDEQGKMEARIRQLSTLLDNAQVGEAPMSDDGSITPGMVVTAEVAGDEMIFLLGSRESAGSTDIDVYSEQSPLGQAVLGLTKGGKASYKAPNGRDIEVKVLDAKPFVG